MGEQVAARANGGVAQLGEHLPCKQGVKSSNLSVSMQDGNILNKRKENRQVEALWKEACTIREACKSRRKRKCRYAEPAVRHPAASLLQPDQQTFI